MSAIFMGSPLFLVYTNLYEIVIDIPGRYLPVVTQIDPVIAAQGQNQLRQRKQVFTAVIGGQQELRLIPADGFGCA